MSASFPAIPVLAGTRQRQIYSRRFAGRIYPERNFKKLDGTIEFTFSALSDTELIEDFHIALIEFQGGGQFCDGFVYSSGLQQGTAKTVVN